MTLHALKSVSGWNEQGNPIDARMILENRWGGGPGFAHMWRHNVDVYDENDRETYRNGNLILGQINRLDIQPFD